MTQYVYILSFYEEYGAQDVCATLDRAKVLDLLKTNWPTLIRGDKTEEFDRLKNLLLQTDEELESEDGVKLSDGWGGLMLHVVRLDKGLTI